MLNARASLYFGLLFLFGVALGSFGCGSSDVGDGGSDATGGGDAPGLTDVELPDPGEATVDTIAVPDTVATGEAVEITCAVTPDKWNVVPTEVTLAGGSGNDTHVDDHTVTFDAPGEYLLACGIAGTDIVDETPVTITVTGAGPSTVDTEVANNPAVAGEATAVTCTALDANGEEVQAEFEIVVEPVGGVEVSGLSATFTNAGDYTVACQVVGGAIDDSPVALAVNPAPLATVTAQLANDEIAAGSSTSVSCLGTDEFGNEVEGLSFSLSADEGVSVDGMDVSATVVGLYDIHCVLDDSDGVTFEADELSVVAGPADALVLTASPERAIYKVGNQVTIEAQVIDAFGNVVPDIAVTEVAPSPEELVTRLEGDVFRFVAEGRVDFTAALVDDAGVTDTLHLICDGSGPAVVIDFPLRGATLDGAPSVTVTGQVIDQVTGVESFTINEEEVTIGEDGSFAHTIDAVHGMNIIASSATDGANQTENSWRSFYYSDAWYALEMATPTGAMVQEGVMAFINQQTLETTDPEWPADAADLAGIFTMMFADLDIMSLIPRPAAVQTVVWCDHEVYVEELTFDAPQVHLTSFGAEGETGGVRLQVVLPNLRGRVDVPADGFCISASGTVTADSIVLDVTLLLQIQDGDVVSDVSVDNVEVNNLDVDVDGALGFLTNWIINFFEDSLGDMIGDVVIDTIHDEVGPIIDQIAEYMHINEQIEIPPLIGEGQPTVITIQTAPSLIQFKDAGVELRMAASVLADRVVDRDPLGAIGRGSCTGGVVGIYELDGERGVELGFADDVLNQAAFSIWYGGALEIDLSAEDVTELGADLSSFGITNLAVALHLLAPPIVEGCANDGRLLIQVGDALLDASFGFMGQPVDMSMYLQVAIDAELVIVDGEDGVELGIVLGELQTLEAEVVSINEEQAGREETFANLIRSAVPPLLSDAAEDPITFAIPSFDLGDLMGELPAGSWLTLNPQVLGRDLGYTEAAGYLARGTAPAGEPTEEPTPAE